MARCPSGRPECGPAWSGFRLFSEAAPGMSPLQRAFLIDLSDQPEESSFLILVAESDGKDWLPATGP